MSYKVLIRVREDGAESVTSRTEDSFAMALGMCITDASSGLQGFAIEHVAGCIADGWWEPKTVGVDLDMEYIALVSAAQAFLKKLDTYRKENL